MHSQQSSQSNLFAVLCEEFFLTDRLLLWRLPATAAFSSVPSLASNLAVDLGVCPLTVLKGSD